MVGLSRVTHLLITKQHWVHFVNFRNKQSINVSSPDATNNDKIGNPCPDTAVQDADESLSSLRDTSTNEKGDNDDDNNKNTVGDYGGAHQKKSDSTDIGIELDQDATVVLEDNYLVKWGEVGTF
jgi:hypothetical protein